MNLWKSGLSVAVGYAAWTLIFLGGTAAIRALRPGVHDEAGVTSDIATLSIYLVISFVASLVAGVLAAQIAPALNWLMVRCWPSACWPQGFPFS